uniref:Reverse transcriptase domain-containing protein n=1 Tax=Panagrolaimus sp. JU765 TaxID=591449 RepID=A0AC34RQX6_9BILA
MRIISVYAPPDLSTEEFINLLDDIKMLADQSKIIIMGDFNRSKIKWTGNEYFAPDSTESYLIEFMKTLELNQMVKLPTRENHILDLIFIRKNMESYNLEVLDSPMNHKTGKPVSDHRQIRFKTPIKLNTEVPTPKLNYFKSNYPTINWKMNQINWTCILDGLSAEHIYQKLTKLIQKFIHDFTPTNSNKERKLPSHIKNCIEKRDRLLLTDSLKYSKVISDLTSIIYKKLDKYNRNREAAALNSEPTKIYAHIKKATKPAETIPTIHDQNGKLAVTDHEKADLFKDYFSSVFKESYYESLPRKDDGSIELYKWNELNSWNILRKLPAKANSSIDGIPNVILRNCCSAIAQPVTMLFNSIIQNEVIPDEMKTSIMIPIHKKGSKHILTNWRGINLQSSMAKLLDKYLNKIFMEHVEKNNIIPRQQHGFTKNKSVTTNLLEALELITKTMDQNKPSYCVYFDISKAFDLVDHGLLLNKLYNDDIDPKLFKLLEQFINGRKFKVKINNTYSELGQMSSGVPQGSTLGPN